MKLAFKQTVRHKKYDHTETPDILSGMKFNASKVNRK